MWRNPVFEQFRVSRLSWRRPVVTAFPLLSPSRMAKVEKV
jgi:hypothetical protein